MSFIYPNVEDIELPRERSGHISVYWNGYIIVWGGYRDTQNIQLPEFIQETYHDSVEFWLFSVESSTWRHAVTSGDVPPPLSGSCAACIDDAMYLFAGHCDNGPTSKVYMLDLKTLVWRDLSDTINKGVTPSPRDKLCCWHHKELLIFFGGYGTPPTTCNGSECYGEFVYNSVDLFGDNRGWNNNVYILDTLKVEWVKLKITGDGPSPRAAHAAAKLQSKAYVFGGRFMSERRNDLYCLDLEEWNWSGSLLTTGCVPGGRSWHSLTPVSEKHLLLYGGYNNNREPLGDVYLLDTESLIWTNITPDNNIPRMWHTACATSVPGEVVIFGGCSTSLLDDAEPKHSNKVIIYRFSPLPLKSVELPRVVKAAQEDPKVTPAISYTAETIVRRKTDLVEGVIARPLELLRRCKKMQEDPKC